MMSDYKYKVIPEVNNKSKKTKEIVKNAFDTEFLLMKNNDIKNFLFELLRMAPGYFYSAPSSSTGKHHPAYEFTKGGIILHTKAVVYFLMQMLELEEYDEFDERQRDLLIAAAILHDVKKHGLNPHSEYTNFEHPRLAAEFILTYKDCGVIPEKEIVFIADVVKTHMGQWNTNGKNSKYQSLEKPKTKAQKLIHLCDYLASREDIDLSKYLNINEFNQNQKKHNKNKINDISNVSNDAILTFGKYKGKTLKEIFEKDVEYLNWCYSTNAQKVNAGEGGFIGPNLNEAIKNILFPAA